MPGGRGGRGGHIGWMEPRASSCADRHRRHTSFLAAMSTCSERDTSDGLSSVLSSGLTWRRTALRGASAGLRHSACARSASRSTVARNIAARVWKRGSYISGPSCAGRVKRADTRLGGLPPVFL